MLSNHHPEENQKWPYTFVPLSCTRVDNVNPSSQKLMIYPPDSSLSSTLAARAVTPITVLLHNLPKLQHKDNHDIVYPVQWEYVPYSC